MLLTPSPSRAFPWTVAAFAALMAMHGAYWILTHPLNKFWLRQRDLTGFTGGFIRFDPADRDAPEAAGDHDWTQLRAWSQGENVAGGTDLRVQHARIQGATVFGDD